MAQSVLDTAMGVLSQIIIVTPAIETQHSATWVLRTLWVGACGVFQIPELRCTQPAEPLKQQNVLPVVIQQTLNPKTLKP